MRRLRSLLLLVPAVLFQVGCSSTATPSANNVDSNGQQISSVPWNKPEDWETTGQLGGLQQ